MALSLKDPETDRLAREVAKVTGDTLTGAVKAALTEKLERERMKRAQPADVEAQLARVRALIESFKRLPVLDARSADDILGYGEDGLPR